MKKLLALLLSALCLLCSCGKADTSGYNDVIKAAENSLNSSSYSAKFRLNTVFGDEKATLLFAQGSYLCDKTAGYPVVSASMTQNTLGTAASVKVDYNGSTNDCKTTVDDTMTTESISQAEFFSQLIYAGVLTFPAENVSFFKSQRSGADTIYTVGFNDVSNLIYPFFGESIYSITLITKPQHELFECRDVFVCYTVTGGDAPRVSDITLSFDMLLYDTPPYVPSGKQPDLKDYMLEVYVEFTASFTE